MPGPPPAQFTYVGLGVEDVDKMADFNQRRTSAVGVEPTKGYAA
jgi:hypothetical protein